MNVSSAQQTVLIRRSIRRRREGRIVAPVVDAHTLKDFPISFQYGAPTAHSSSGRHRGEDHACPVGSFVLAVTWGEVVHVTDRGGPVVSWGGAYGTHVVIRTATGEFDYALCHLSRAAVTPGTKVRPGQVIGYSGATGNVTGPHVHLEARPAGGRLGSDLDPRNVKLAPVLEGAHV
jgi:murein DD-endopeptidase MepM/ murein hydrolase activator NlpD